MERKAYQCESQSHSLEIREDEGLITLRPFLDQSIDGESLYYLKTSQRGSRGYIIIRILNFSLVHFRASQPGLLERSLQMENASSLIRHGICTRALTPFPCA